MRSGLWSATAEEIGFNRYTILNLHAILASNLLPDESAAGRIGSEIGMPAVNDHDSVTEEIAVI